MKKIFLRRILPMAMCLLMVLPLFAFNVVAGSLDGIPGDRSIIGTERQNWAPNGQTYHTSAWNYDSHSKYINNGTYGHSYQFWRPSDPSRANGAGVDPEKQNFGVSFDDGYYLVDEIVIFADTYAKGYNNIKYTVEALILGEWVVVGTGYQDDGHIAYECSKCGYFADNNENPCPSCGAEKENLKTFAGSGGNGTVTRISIKLEHPDGNVIYQCSECGTVVESNAAACSCGASADKIDTKSDINTNNIRIWCSEYGSNAKRYGDYADNPATEHDWWLVPLIQEVEIMGVTGYRPEFDVPMNAYLVTNAALSGMIGADSKLTSRYPGAAGDDQLDSSWKARNTGAQNIWAEFDNEYPISKVGINVGGCGSSDTGLNLKYNIKLLLSGTIEDGEWMTVVTDASVTTTKELMDFISVELDEPVNAIGMMVEITEVKNSNGRDGRAVMTELLAEIADGGKCIFLADYMTSAKKMSTATGNLACYGNAYASSNFSYASISKISNIIDGNITYSDSAWIAANYLVGTYVGVELKEAHNVTKVALYFNDLLGGENGEYVFEFDLQAKVNGEFVTIATGTTYDAEKKKYISVIELSEAVYTDDVRVVFTSDAQTFPYLKEIEIFEGDFIYSSFDGYALDTSRTVGGPAVTNVFGNRTVAVRGKYLDKTSPIEYFNIALDHDVEIDWLG